MKKYLKKLPLFMTLLFLLVVSCSKTEEHNTEPYTGFYNFKSLYTNDLLLKIASKNESVSYYGTTNGDHIDLLMSLYKDNATGRRTIYKTNSTADTAIIYNFDKPEFGGILFIKRSSNILVQEFEFQSDNKTIKPTLYLTTIPVSLNRFSPSNIASSEDDSKFMDKEIDETGAWFMTAGMSEIIKSIEKSISNFKETRKELLDDLYKMPETINKYVKSKSNKNPEPLQEPISNDPAPNSDPIEPLPSHRIVDCNNVVNGTAYIDGWCNKCVEGNTGVPRCGPAIDCSGTPDGKAYKDDCNKCVGGNTGNTACVPVVKDTILSIKKILEGKVWNSGKSAWTASGQTATEIKFQDCCYGGSQSNYYWEFRYDKSANKIYVDGISGFNGYTQTFELLSISSSAFSIVCIAGSNCNPGDVSNFPR